MLCIEIPGEQPRKRGLAVCFYSPFSVFIFVRLCVLVSLPSGVMGWPVICKYTIQLFIVFTINAKNDYNNKNTYRLLLKSSVAYIC